MPHVKRRAFNGRTVRQALDEDAWLQDFGRGISVPTIWEFLRLWDVIQQIQLRQETPARSVTYTSKSAYRRFFMGSTIFEPHKRLWKTWAPARTKFFLWLAIQNRCWTSDRLRRRGLQHPERCPLCDQEEKTMQHILTNCVIAREVWYNVLRSVGLQAVAPDQANTVFKDWWAIAEQRISKEQRKGFNTLVILVAWNL